ncbi:MAG: acyl carrier protein [Actinomycetota bacterium]
MREMILNYIREDILGEGTPPDLTAQTPLLSSGLMDSLGVEQLVLFLEEELGVEFDDPDLSAANFNTVASIERLVQRTLSSAAGDGARGSLEPRVDVDGS